MKLVNAFYLEAWRKRNDRDYVRALPLTENAFKHKYAREGFEAAIALIEEHGQGAIISQIVQVRRDNTRLSEQLGKLKKALSDDERTQVNWGLQREIERLTALNVSLERKLFEASKGV